MSKQEKTKIKSKTNEMFAKYFVKTCQNQNRCFREKKNHAQILKNELRIIFVAFDILTRVEKIKTWLKVSMAYKTFECKLGKKLDPLLK